MRKNIFLWLLVIAIAIPIVGLAAITGKPACTKITRTLKYGSTDTKANTDVVKLQRFLKAQGYYTGTIGGGFGAKTKTALQRFQVASGLYVAGVSKKSGYGVVDSKTRFKIQQLSCTKAGITVTDPNVALSLSIGTTKNITWTANNVSKVDIFLRDRSRSTSNPTDTLIISNVDASAGSYSWTVPSNIVPNNRYSVLIRGDGVSDESNFYFSIVAIVRGGGGGGGGGGSCRDLYWFDDRDPDCANNGARTFCSDLPTNYGFTSADTLVACQAKMPTMINVILSSGAAGVQRGVPITINWTDRASTTKYDLKLVGTGNSSQNIRTEINPFSRAWTMGTVGLDSSSDRQVPSVVDTGRYNIQVCRHGSSVCGVSPDVQIGNARFISSPSSGSSYLSGDTVSLNWSNSSGGELAGAKATLYKGTSVSAGNSVTPGGDGKTASWPVPSGITTGSDYFFRVVSRNTPYTFYESRNFSIGGTSNGSTILVDANPVAVARGSVQAITWRDSISTSTYNVLLRSYSNGTQYWLASNSNMPANGSGVHTYSWTAGNDVNGNPIPEGSYHYTICHAIAGPCGQSADSSDTELALTSDNSYVQLPDLSATCGDVSCNDASNGHPIWHARPAEPSSRYYLACTAATVGSPYYRSGAVIADLGRSQALSRVNIDFRQTDAEAPGQAPCSYILETSTDGDTWSLLDDGIAGSSCTAANQLTDLDISASSRQARYVRLSYGTAAGTCLALNKFNVMLAGGVSSRNNTNQLASITDIFSRILSFFKK